MRQLGTLSTIEAKRFAMFVRTRGIATDLRPDADGRMEIWIQNEDQLAAARNEFDAFVNNPSAARFDAPPLSQAEVEPSPMPGSSASPNRKPSWRRLPVTCGLIGATIVICLVAWFGGAFGDQLRGNMAIVPITIQGNGGTWVPTDGLGAIRQGQVWRLITPIFPHADPVDGGLGNIFHLLFNMAWLWLLGGAIETVRGSWRLALLVLFSAVASNLAEYYFNFGFDFSRGDGFKSDIGFSPNPMFLGMSGVVFALFGFVWVRSRLFTRSGFIMPRDMVVWMLIWLLVCTSGLAGPIANVAHGVGLLVGIVLGAAPRLWRRA